MCFSKCVCVCVCVFVRERERGERERVVGVVLGVTSCSPKHNTCMDGVCGELKSEEKALG